MAVADGTVSIEARLAHPQHGNDQISVTHKVAILTTELILSLQFES